MGYWKLHQFLSASGGRELPEGKRKRRNRVKRLLKKEVLLLLWGLYEEKGVTFLVPEGGSGSCDLGWGGERTEKKKK